MMMEILHLTIASRKEMQTQLLLFSLLVFAHISLGFSNIHGTKDFRVRRGPVIRQSAAQSAPDLRFLGSDHTMLAVPEKADLRSSSINLLKNAVGGGVFSLSANLLTISAVSDTTMIPKATILVFVFAAWAAYNFFIVTEVSRLTGESTYSDCWSSAVSPDTRWIVQSMVSLAPLIGCLSNTIILTDLLVGLLQATTLPAAIFGNRAIVVFFLCSGVILPLCSMPNLRALRGTSIIGLIGQILAMALVGVRVYDKSYLPGGVFASAAHASAQLSESPSVLRWFTFASLVSYCYVTHYNAPKYFTELDNSTPRRTYQMIGTAYLGAAIFYAISLYLGIAAFGSTVKPYLMSNLSHKDPLAPLARLAIGASILASTPLMFINVRNTLVNAAKIRLPILGTRSRMAAVLVYSMGLLAARLTDVGKIGSIAGAMFGVNMMFTIPPIMYIGALRKAAEKSGEVVEQNLVGINYALAMCGVALSMMATYHSLAGIFR